MGRLAFLPIAIIATLVAIRLDLNYAGFAVLIGILIPVASLLWNREVFATTASGFVFVALGAVLLILAYLVAYNHGISLEALDHDRSFPKVVRRLPYFGISSITAGLTIMVISIFHR